jgi:hypothetical protein
MTLEPAVVLFLGFVGIEVVENHVDNGVRMRATISFMKSGNSTRDARERQRLALVNRLPTKI